MCERFQILDKLYFCLWHQTVFLSLASNCISVSGIKLSKNDHFRSGSRPSASTSAEPDIKIVATVPGQVVVNTDHHGHVDHNGFEDGDDHNAR